jgi:acetylornithine deacetylase/succinyl-diaminopimelate desuccinylase-like protein
MMTLATLAQRYADKRDAIIADYLTFLRFASVSSEAAYRKPLHDCLHWLQQALNALPFAQEIWESDGPPILFASYDGAGPDQPTLLIYNHYDVQPVDPLDEWESPPFEPTIRDGQVYARGAQDNKGQCFYVLEALRGLYERDGCFPINIKLCIEGDEEIGSVALSALVSKKSRELAADYLLIVDVGIHDLQSPSVSLGVRGIVTLEVLCRGSSTDMHSGMAGGIVYNPIHALVEMLAKLRDAQGKIAVPHFYDDVAPLSPAEKKMLAMDFDAVQFRETFAAEPTGGEQGLTPYERGWLRPTLEINGICGGYSGPGFKTVIPATASAKLSCRLVPNQDPLRIGKLVTEFLTAQAPPGIAVSATVLPGVGTAVRANPHSPLVRALSTAYTEVFHKPCQRILTGGSIGIAAKLAAASGAEILLVGLGLPSDKIHAPNEHFGLDRIEMGYLIIARAIELLKRA